MEFVKPTALHDEHWRSLIEDRAIMVNQLKNNEFCLK